MSEPLEIAPIVARRRLIPRGAKQAVIVIVVLGAGVGGAVGLASLRKPPASDPPAPWAPLVETAPARSIDAPVSVAGHGTVRARTVVRVIPRVSGPVLEMHPGLVRGGHFGAGEPLFRIDDEDAARAVRDARAKADDAEAVLALADARVEEARARLEDAVREVARQRELVADELADRRALEQAELAELLVRRQLDGLIAQRRSADVGRRAAAIGIERAEAERRRTVVSVPFAGRVLEEDLDVGQYLQAGAPVATVYGTDSLEVLVPFGDADLGWISVPGGRARGDGEAGSPARIVGRQGGVERTWTGQVVRLEAEVDARSQMTGTVIDVAGDAAAGDDGPPRPGLFVRVEIEGRRLDGLAVPRRAVRDGRRLWVITDGKLRFREVEIVRADRELAYVRGGVAAGDQVVVSQLEAVTDGMAVRVVPAGARGGPRVSSASGDGESEEDDGR